MKELYNENSKFAFMSILLKMTSKSQKFKIHFKNYSMKEIEMDLLFEKTSFNSNVFSLYKKFFECQFILFPNKLTVPSLGIIEVELIGKIKKFKGNVEKNKNFELDKIGNKIRKVLIGRFKNASFFIRFLLK